jgi:NADH-quinone oxidoreductase subunit E
MIPSELRQELARAVDGAEQPREQAVDVMYALQKHYGYLSDDGVREAADILGLTPLEVEELATFYDFIYREPVGRYVIHVCDGAICWMFHENRIFDHLCRGLGIGIGETTADGLFTLLPVACIGYCDRAPAMLVNGVAYGNLTPEKIDRILEKLRAGEPPPAIDR